MWFIELNEHPSVNDTWAVPVGTRIEDLVAEVAPDRQMMSSGTLTHQLL